MYARLLKANIVQMIPLHITLLYELIRQNNLYQDNHVKKINIRTEDISF